MHRGLSQAAVSDDGGMGWVSRRAVVERVLDAVNGLAWDHGPVPTPPARLGPRMLLTLLTYCYTTGVYGSEDIVWATRTEPFARYLCGGAPLEAADLRRFRRAFRAPLEACLAAVLEGLPLELRRSLVPAPGGPASSTSAWAQRQLDRAVLMDTAASE